MINDSFAQPIVHHATKTFESTNTYDPKKPSLKIIFHYHWDEFCELPYVKNVGMRPVVPKEIKRMLSCGTIDAGFEVFECPHCHKVNIICYTCKSRFCSSCGAKRVKEQSAMISKITLPIPHRHVVFTIDERLRVYFRKNYQLLDVLFDSARQTIEYAFKKLKGKKNAITPGYVLTLHTFGRDLKWNPHIHCLLTEGGLTKTGDIVRINYINYEVLRKGFMKCVLDNLKLALQDDQVEYKKFKALVNQIYKDDENGFYVYGPEAKDDSISSIDELIQYVVRYTARPVMAQSRITDYDPDKKEIAYYYEDHKTNERVDVRESVYDFIGKLIIHIPEEQFKMVRYYGIYATGKHKLKKFMRVIRMKYKKIEFKKFCYRRTLISVFNTDPLLCTCGHYMEYVDNYIPDLRRNDAYEDG